MLTPKFVIKWKVNIHSPTLCLKKEIERWGNYEMGLNEFTSESSRCDQLAQTKKKVINVSGARVILLACIFCPKILGIWRIWTPKVGKLSNICGIVFESWDILLANSFSFALALVTSPRLRLGQFTTLIYLT